MGVGLSPAIANNVLNGLCRNAAITTLPIAAFWVQLHIGDPGAAGTSNAAVNTTRHQATMGTVASGGAISNTADITWSTSEVSGSEDYTHWTGWSASTAGTFLCSGLVTANAVVAANQFIILTGDLDLGFLVAS
jgi:hypothetical protein